MNERKSDLSMATTLLRPRQKLPWGRTAALKICWSRPFIIENRVTRAAAEKALYGEQAGREILRGHIEGELAALTAAQARFWQAEYGFLEKMMSLSQLTIYAPAFVRLARIMPRKLVFCRRMVVRKYLDRELLAPNRFIGRLSNRFVRSSVLLYPAEKLVSSADRFLTLARRSADQSAAANRERVVMVLRSLHMMTDQEICDQFQQEVEYLAELELLAELARHYRIGLGEVFRVTAEEMAWFWERHRQGADTIS